MDYSSKQNTASLKRDKIRTASGSQWLLVVSASTAFLAIALLYSFLPGVWGSSEAREAQVLAAMRYSHEYILPLRNGLIPSKPPLFHWLGVAILAFVPEAPIVAARSVSVLAALSILLVAGQLARVFSRVFFVHDLESERRLFWLTPAVLLTSYSFVAMITDARVDMLFAAFVTAAVATLVGTPTLDSVRMGALERADKESLGRRFAAFYLCAGLAVLTKGPLGVALPVLLGFSWHLSIVGVRRAVFVWLRPRVGWLLFALVALPWYLAAALKGGEGFVGRQIFFENIHRMLGGDYVNKQPWHFYFYALTLGTLPWCLVFFRWSYSVARSCFRAADRLSPTQKIEKGLFFWFWVGFTIFSIAAGKRGSYLIPLLPAFAIAVTLQVNHFLMMSSAARLTRVTIALTRTTTALMIAMVVAIAALSLVHVPYLAPSFTLSYWPTELVTTAAVVQGVLGVTLCLLVWRRASAGEKESQSIDSAAISLFSFLALIALSSATVCWSAKSGLRGFEGLAAQMSNIVGNERTMVVRERADEYFDPMLYYMGPQVSWQPPQEFSLHCPAYTLSRTNWVQEHWADLQRSGNVTEVGRFSEWRFSARTRKIVQAGREDSKRTPVFSLVRCQ